MAGRAVAGGGGAAGGAAWGGGAAGRAGAPGAGIGRAGAAFGGSFRFVSCPLSVGGAACANWTGPDCAREGVIISEETVRADVASKTKRKFVMTTFFQQKFRQQTRACCQWRGTRSTDSDKAAMWQPIISDARFIFTPTDQAHAAFIAHMDRISSHSRLLGDYIVAGGCAGGVGGLRGGNSSGC